jgi:hypothetical protein
MDNSKKPVDLNGQQPKIIFLVVLPVIKADVLILEPGVPFSGKSMDNSNIWTNGTKDYSGG